MGRTNASFKTNNHFDKIKTYDAFEAYIKAFADGKFNCLVIIGPPGIGKSESIRRAIEGKEVLYCNGGQMTPIQFFMECFQNVDKPIILDDADQIMSTKVGKHLIMSLTDTREEKTIEYKSSSKILGETPTKFNTKSRVCYLANSWLSASPQAVALEDRGHLVQFDPPPKAIHLHTAKWFKDPEIYDYIGKHLHLIDRHSSRIYFNAKEKKDANMNWKDYVMTMCHDTNHSIVQQLQHESGLLTEKDRIAKFIKVTGLSRATYFNYKKELDKKEQLELPENLALLGV